MRKSRWTLGLSLLLPFALVLAAMFADLSPVHSAPLPDKTFAVNDNSDVIDANPADGNCISLEATCTLRDAIQQANALYASSGGAYTITLPAATYSLSISGAGEDNAASGDLDFKCNLTILGNPLAPATIDAGNIDDRVFEIRQSDAVPHSVTFSYVNIINGHGTSDGGGIRSLNLGTTTLDHVRVMSNTVSGNSSKAGAIDNLVGGTLVLNNSVVRANSVISGTNGGGIVSNGLTILNFTSVESNTVRSDINTTSGGGIDANGSFGVVLNNSQVLSNTVFAKAGPALASGGGININNGPLTITNSLIRNNLSQAANTSSGTMGGGIYLAHGSLKLVSSMIMNNQATAVVVDARGGGIMATGNSTLSIEQSTMTGNSARDGGGINLFGANATISNSTFIANTAVNGGGIQVQGNLMVYGSMFNINTATAGDGGAVNNAGTLTVTNSTFTFNNASNNGGGIFNKFSSSKMILASDTFFLNVADSDDTGGGDGGGIFNNSSGGSVVLRNPILSLNMDMGSNGTNFPECAGTLFSLGYNLLQDTTGCNHQNQTGDILGMNPLLGLLLNNGGPTLTDALPANSIAVNGGDPSGCKNVDGSPLLVDQRGFPRLGACDIGAFEYQLRLFLPLIRR